MAAMNFEYYGKLEWLDPSEFYAGAWKPIDAAEGEDGEQYDIVILGDCPCELRYTNI